MIDYSPVIVDLYAKVFDKQKLKFSVDSNNIRKAFQNMKEAYLPNPGWEYDDEATMANYNDPAHRCAYLHKYAMVHTGLLCEILQTAFKKYTIYQKINSKRKLKLCSLGGGPGSDIVAFLIILRQVFGFISCDVTVIDYAINWKYVFEDIVAALKSGRYGNVREMVNGSYFSYEYFCADLLNMSYYKQLQIYYSITNADVITMIKFISAAACDKTRKMVKQIFHHMKPGAMLLFVDNAAGGFQTMLQHAAYEYGMETVFGPLQHYDYEETNFNRKLYGYTSQWKTKVVIQIWKKPDNDLLNSVTKQLRREFENQSVRPARTANITLGSRRNEQVHSEETGCCSIM